MKTTIIHPATEKHIEKYSAQNIYMIDETPVIYKNITLPHIKEEQFDLQVNALFVSRGNSTIAHFFLVGV